MTWETQTADERLHHIHDALDWLETHPDLHIKEWLAKDHNGKPIPPSDPHACRFCVMGRIMREAGIETEEVRSDLFTCRDYLEPFGLIEDVMDFQNINDFARSNRSGKKEALDDIRKRFPPRPEVK